MNVDYKSSFHRHVKKITDPTLKERVRQAVNSVKEAQTPKDIPELRKVKGNKNGISFRIKVGTYRIGVTIENNLVIFVAFGHRKDIYKIFP